MFTQWNKAFEKSVLDCYESNIGLLLSGADSSAIALCLADHKLSFLSVTCLNNQKAEDLDTLQAVINYTKEYNTHFEILSYKKLDPFMEPFFPYVWDFSPILSCIDTLDTKIILTGQKFATARARPVPKPKVQMRTGLHSPLEVYSGKRKKSILADVLYNDAVISMLTGTWLRYPFVNEELILQYLLLNASDYYKQIKSDLYRRFSDSVILESVLDELAMQIDKEPVKQYLRDRNIPLPKVAGVFSDQYGSKQNIIKNQRYHTKKKEEWKQKKI